MRFKLLSSVLLTVGVLLSAVACEPEAPVPAPNAQILVVGDSITWQVVMSGVWPDAEMVQHTMFGWKVSDVQNKVTEMAMDGSLGTLVVALGTNDSNPASGGWTRDDELEWSTLLYTPHDSAKVVIVLPWLSGAAPADHRAEIDKARAWMINAAALRPNTVLVDWADRAAPVLGADGIHLEPVPGQTVYPVTNEASAARLATIREGL